MVGGCGPGAAAGAVVPLTIGRPQPSQPACISALLASYYRSLRDYCRIKVGRISKLTFRQLRGNCHIS